MCVAVIESDGAIENKGKPKKKGVKGKVIRQSTCFCSSAVHAHILG